MRPDQQPGPNPQAMKQVHRAFDAAWATLKNTTTAADREHVREAIGKAIVGLAKTGYRNADHLANYGAYHGRLFKDLRCK
jgi:hypothetical protein